MNSPEKVILKCNIKKVMSAQITHSGVQIPILDHSLINFIFSKKKKRKTAKKIGI